MKTRFLLTLVFTILMAMAGVAQVTFGPVPDQCRNAASFVLTQGSPSGGTYSGPGVFSNRFYPSSAGVGTHTIYYTLGSDTDSVAVNVLPTPDNRIFVDNQYCSSSGNLSKKEECYEYTWYDVRRSINTQGVITVCENTPTTYSVTPGGGYTYNWTVNGGVVTSGQNTPNATITWGVPAQGSLKVIITSSNGCIDSSEVCVDIIPIPTASFTGNNVCLGVPTQFNNNSTGAVSYRWDFGDGTSSTQTNPNHIYSGPGNYTVTLTAYNECGCSHTASQVVNVGPIPGANIICPATACFGDTLTYKTDVNCSGYTWAANGGTIVAGQGTNQILVNWGNGPVGTLSLTTSGCTPAHCSQATTINVPIIQPNPNISGIAVVCENEIQNYTMPSWPGANYTWTVIPSAAGNIRTGQTTNRVNVQWLNGTANPTAKLVVTVGSPFLGCTVTDTLDIKIKPNFRINGNSAICRGGSSQLSATPGSAFTWTVQGGNISSGQGTNVVNINWTSPTGAYTITAVPNNPADYCNAVATRVVYIREVFPLDSIDGPSYVCPNSSGVYNARISPSIGGTYSWTIQNGSLSSNTGSQVTATWGASGPYSISARHHYADCASPIVTKTVQSIVANPPPISGTTVTCAGNSQVFTYSVPTIAASNVSYVWSVSPASAGSVVSGRTSRVAGIRYNTGITTATVNIAITVCGTVLNSSQTITILPAPNPSISATNLCPDSFITISSPTAYPGYSWNNGATTQSTIISNPGTYQLIVTAANGCTNLVRRTIPLRRKPKAAITTDGFRLVCSGTPVNITLHAPRGQGFSFLWYHNGTNTGITTQTFVATAPDTFAVKTTNAWGCTNLAKLKLDTVPCPSGGGPGGGPPAGGGPGAGAGAGGAGAGGAGGAGFIPPMPGTGTPPTLGNGIGIGNKGSGLQTLSGAPGIGGQMPIIQAQEICSKYVRYTDLSPPTPVAWWWNFGDPVSGLQDSSSQQNPLHEYSSPGSYLVTLWAQYPSGIWVWDTLQIHIPAFPDFDWTPRCQSAIEFYDLSTYAPSTPITSWFWEFGDGNTSNAQNPTHNYATGGVYSVTLTLNAGSCTVKKVRNVTAWDPPTADFSFPSPNCSGSPVQFTDLSNSGTTPITRWQWWFGDGATSSTQHPQRTYATGNYNARLRVTNANGCTAEIIKPISISGSTTTGTITANRPISNGRVYICENDSVTLTSSPASSYLWTTGETTQSITVGTANNYAVSTFSLGTCFGATTPITVIVRPLPTFSMSPDPAILCSGKSLTLYARNYPSSSTFRWHDSSGPISGSNGSRWYYSTNTPGTYSVVVTKSGCSTTGTLDVTPVPSPTLTIDGATSLCPGESATLTASVVGGTGPISYAWYQGQTTSQITVSDAGRYGLNVRDSNNCSVSASTNITAELGPDLSLFPLGCYTRCNVETINGPPGYASYEWIFNGNSIGTSQNITTNQSGIYNLVLKTAFGCTDTSGDLFLNIVPDPIADAGPDTVICPGDTAFLHGSGTGVAAIDLWKWTPAGSLNNDTIHNPSATPGTTTNYELEITDMNGCYDKDTMTVLVYCNFPLISVTGDSICAGDCGTLTASISPGTGTPPFTWNWNSGHTDSVATGLCPGTSTWYYVTLTDSFGFVTRDSGLVYVYPTMTLTPTGNDVLCNGDDNGSASINVSGGTPGYTYNWMPGNITTDTTGKVLAPGVYTVEVTDSKGCSMVDTVTISEPPPLTVSITPNGASCHLNNGSALANPSGGTSPYTYNWSNGANTQLATALLSGMYTVTVTDASGCTAVASDSITDTELPVASFVADDTVGCATLCITFTNNTPNSTAMWNYGDGNSGSGDPSIHCYTDAGTYSVKLVVTDGNGCKDSLEKVNYITVHPIPVASFTAQPQPTSILSPQISFTNISQGAILYDWDFGDNSSSSDKHPVHTYEDTGSYVTMLIVENEFGCKDTTEQTIIIDPDFVIYVPNAFTPNGDVHNNLFFAKMIGVAEFEMWIYDRWGNMIFNTTDMNVGWNGKVMGSDVLVQQDVYVWVIRLTDVLGEKHRYVGHVTVIR